MENNNNRFLKGFLCGLLAAILVLGAAFGVFASATGVFNTVRSDKIEEVKSNEEEDGVQDESVYLKLQEIEGKIEDYYLNEVDQEALTNGLYAGYVSGLGDPYSVYYTEDELNSMLESTSGSYYGIGATMSQNYETGIITIVQPFKEAPAAEAGLLPGDILYMVEDEEVTGIDLTAVVAKIKGEEGTNVKLTIVREGENDYLDFEVTRRQIEVPTIEHDMLDDNIGYIQVVEFDEVTLDQFKQALADLENQGMEGLIIDLRNNPGGVLSIVCEMLEQILPEGLIVYTEDKYGQRQTYSCDGKNEFTKPLAVLVNGNSASASEIFAGAVKDHGVGKIVGTTTYGKGIVQKIINLSDGTAVKLTISKYYTPNGNDIHEIGIEPDVEEELAEELRQQVVITHEEDNQLQKAIEVIKTEQ